MAPIGPRSSVPSAGSARKPIARLVIVMPSWAPLSCVDSDRRATSVPWAPRSPAAARRSTSGRSTARKEDSAATNKPHATMSTAETPSRIHSTMAATVPLDTVPTYQYSCNDCGEALEVQQSFSDDSLTVCPACLGRLRKVYNAVGVVFKGSGFYRTDSRAASAGSNSNGSSSDGTSSSSSESSSAPAKSSSSPSPATSGAASPAS